MKDLRNFEISVWTLQDEFITVIEDSNNKLRGKTQDATITLNVDGTQELTFSIPMYISKNGQLIENLAWRRAQETILVNTRKIKVILNKKFINNNGELENNDSEEIYEFVIDKITERHENDQLYCDVVGTGLAFYELGKIGYKISLSSDDFYADDLSWFNEETDKNGNLLFEEQPVANIQYWIDKFLTRLDDEDNILNNSFNNYKWYYTIQMDWSEYFNYPGSARSNHKIYEDNDDYQFDNGEVTYAEKARMIDLEESNVYNLTQNIAERFEVYCKYKYIYDENYHIIGRVVIFYNDFLLDNNQLSITYRKNTSSITREIDSTDLVTKMYVKTANDDEISILDAEENEVGEDFLLDFDYLYSIKSVSQDAYDYIPTYKENLQRINNKLKIEFEKRILIEDKLPEIRARKTTASDAISLDQENIDTSNKMLLSLTGGTGEIEVTDSKPDSAALIKQSDGSGDTFYYINLHRHGIKPNTLKIFRSFNSSIVNGQRLDEEIKTGIPVFDEYNNLIQMKNIYWSTGSKIVYLTYTYEPQLYYENITKVWMTRLEKDRQTLQKATTELGELETQLEEINNTIDELLKEKEAENEYFSNLMGACLREGYWQPEDYADKGNSYVATYNLEIDNIADDEEVKIIGRTKYDSFLWDTQLFDDEQDIKYTIGMNEEIYYPCINLSNVWDFIYQDLDNFSFIFNDTSLNDGVYSSDGVRRNNFTTLRILPFGSGAKIVFVKDNQNNVIPVLLLIGAEAYTSDTLTNMRNNGIIGVLKSNSEGNVINFSISPKYGYELNWLVLNDNFKTVYPRIRIESLLLKDDNDSLSLHYAEKQLTKYTDYYITTRSNLSEHFFYQESDGTTVTPLIASKYITIKPETIIKSNNGLDKIKLYFKLSDAANYIYLDAMSVIKENSKPKVSYNVDLDIIKYNFINQPSLFLNRIVKINDNELKFENVKGYISEVVLNLDRPWEDQITVQNYKTKFEDLFSNILVQTEEMKKSSYLLNTVANSFSLDGSLLTSTLQGALNRVDLNYAFNNGRLTIDEENGIWGTSDSGVVAFRGGGIFTSTQKDGDNNWIWNTGITPEGINANLITSGQIDTGKIRIYAGDKVRFQLNGDGLFGYKSFFEDFAIFYNSSYVGTNVSRERVLNKIKNEGDVDASQFIEFNENGLFLVAKENAFILNENKTDYMILTRTYEDDKGIARNRLDEDLELKRVSITWDGLRLKNLNGDSVFFADADTGNLRIKGSVYANAFYVITEPEDEFGNVMEVSRDIATFINDTSLTALQTRLKNNTDVGARIKSYINAAATAIGGRYVKAIDDAESKYTQGTSYPDTPSIGDMFYNTSTHKTYLCIATEGSDNEKWQEIVVSDTNAQMNIDSNTGTIAFNSSKSISFSAIENNNGITNYSVLSITTNGIGMNSNKGIDINGGKISITSATVNGTTTNGAIEITSGGTFSAVGNNFWIGAVDYNEWISKTDTQKNNLGIAFIRGYNQNGKYHLEIASSDSLRIASGGSLTLESGSSININATGSITLMSGTISAIELSSTGISLASTKTLKIDTANFKLRPDIVYNTTTDTYNNIFFYMGDTFNALNTSPSHYIKYSYKKGLQIKTTNFTLDPTATGTSTIWSIGDINSKSKGYIKYDGNGILTIQGTIKVISSSGDAVNLDDKITTITNNTITTSSLIAQNLKIQAANIQGELVIGRRGITTNISSTGQQSLGSESIYTTIEGGEHGGVSIYLINDLNNSEEEAFRITYGVVSTKVRQTVIEGAILETWNDMSILSNKLNFDCSELYLNITRLYIPVMEWSNNEGYWVMKPTINQDVGIFRFEHGLCVEYDSYITNALKYGKQDYYLNFYDTNGSYTQLHFVNGILQE